MRNRKFIRISCLCMALLLTVSIASCGTASNTPTQAPLATATATPIDSTPTNTPAATQQSTPEITTAPVVTDVPTEVPTAVPTEAPTVAPTATPEVDTVAYLWTDKSAGEYPPLVVFERSDLGSGDVSIVEDFGHEDLVSMKFEVKQGTGTGYVASDVADPKILLPETISDGDTVTVWAYVPANSNVKSLQLQLRAGATSYSTAGTSKTLSIKTSETGTWYQLEALYKSLEPLIGLRVLYTLNNRSSVGTFFIDDIKVVNGEKLSFINYEKSDESIAEVYEDYFKVGCCISYSLIKHQGVQDLINDNFNSITCENETKADFTLDQEGCLANLAKGDNTTIAIKDNNFKTILDFAKENNIKVRYHTLVWHSQTPDWFFTEDYTSTGKTVSKELMLKRLESYIKTVMTYINTNYPGVVYCYDVVNEAIESNNIRRNGSKYYSVIGEDFIYYAFKYAYENKEPGQTLFYNDYTYDSNSTSASFAVNTLLKRAIQDGYVDGVGIQGHLATSNSINGIVSSIQVISNAGLECHITELDVTMGFASQSALNTQAKWYADLFKKVVEMNKNKTANVTSITIWGTADAYSWKESSNPLIFNDNFEKKPSYYSLLNALD